MNPEYYEYVMENLLSEGALDVYLTSIQMKKNRPGIKLSVLCYHEKKDKLIDIILRETSSLGVRIIDDIKRECLARKTESVQTPWGKIKIKVARKEDKVINLAPEYEDCKRVARENSLTLKKVYQTVKQSYLEKI
ncbi:MAG: nickel insertion protein [Halanaerobiales bacterium]